jgi:hypothetical protein
MLTYADVCRRSCGRLSSFKRSLVVARPTRGWAGTEEKRGRGRAWVYIEMLCAVLAVTGVNQDLCDGRSKKERLAHMNTAYKFQVETMVATKKWVDQFGVAEDKTLRDQARRGWRRPPMLFSTLPSFRRPRTASTLLRCMCSSIKGPR